MNEGNEGNEGAPGVKAGDAGDEGDMSCDSFKELAPAFALEVLEGRERVACLRHLAGAAHDGCAEAVADTQAVAARLCAVLPAPIPSPDTWRAILLALAKIE
jgi:hypothetical protein